MLTLSRNQLVRYGIAASVLLLTLLPYMTLAFTAASACTGGGGGHCGGG